MSNDLGFEADTRRGRRALAAGGDAIIDHGRFLKPRTFSDASGISLRTVYREIAEGRIPHVRVGPRGIYIPASHLDDLAAKAAEAVAA